MGPIKIDVNGLIEINDSMSDDLKNRIMEYNKLVCSNDDDLDEDNEEKLLEDDEDDEIQSSDSEFEDEISSPDTDNMDNKDIDDSELDNLNDLFN